MIIEALTLSTFMFVSIFGSFIVAVFVLGCLIAIETAVQKWRS